MSRQDDVELIRVDGPATYAHTADGPVIGFRITDDRGDLGVLWYAEDPAQDAAGIAYFQSERSANAAVHWFRMLREAKARRLPARQATTELVASHADPAPWGAAVGRPERWASLQDLHAEVRTNEA